MTRKTFTKEEIEQLKNKCDELDKTRTSIVKQLEQVEASIALSKVELFLAKNQYNKGDVIKIHVGIGSNRKERILCVPFDEDYDEVIKSRNYYLVYERCFELNKSGLVSKKLIYSDLTNGEVIGTYDRQTRKVTYF
mgnify:CR=1 FL=1|jgi:hypothetical protein